MSAVFSPPPAALPSDKELVLKVIPMPADTNGNGDIFGGWVMAQVDLAGSVLPARYMQGRNLFAPAERVQRAPAERRAPAEKAAS